MPKDGTYEIRLSYVPNANRATNVPITVESAEGAKTVRVDQKQEPARGSSFVSLGTFRFEGGKKGAVITANQGTDGYVIVDAVQCLPVK